MLYLIKAKFDYKKSRGFYRLLQDRTIQKQQPDGPEIVGCMHKATIDADGHIRWTELYFCPVPLQHERRTVYDKFFMVMEIEPISKSKIFEGNSFIRKLAEY